MFHAVLDGLATGPYELKQTAAGSSYLTFAIRVSSRNRDEDGAWREHSELLRVTHFGLAARLDALSQMIRGRRVLIAGRLEISPWKDRSGVPHAGLRLLAADVEVNVHEPREEESSGGSAT